MPDEHTGMTGTGADLGTVFAGIGLKYDQLLRGAAESKRAMSEIELGLGRMESRFDTAQSTVMGFASALQSALSAGTFGGIAYGAANAAARVEVLGTVMGVVGRNAGRDRQELEQEAEVIERLGITAREARQTLIRFMQVQIDTSNAAKLARGAQDLAVIAAKNSSEALGDFTQAIASQNLVILRQYGMAKTAEQVFEEYAVQLGKTAAALTDVERRQAIVNYILDEAAKAAGSYEAAMGDVGKRMTSIPRLLEEAKVALGEGLLPAMGAGVDTLSEMLEWFTDLPPAVREAAGSFLLAAGGVSAITAAAAALGPLLAGPGGLVALLVGLAAAAATFASRSQDLGDRIKTQIDATMRMVDSFKKTAAAYGEQANNLNNLLAEYESLKGKPDRTAEESKRLHEVIKELAKAVPDAAEGLDKYGNAAGINADKVREAARKMAELQMQQLQITKQYLEARMPYLRSLAEQAAPEATEKWKEYQSALNRHSRLLELRAKLLDKTVSMEEKERLIAEAAKNNRGIRMVLQDLAGDDLQNIIDTIITDMDASEGRISAYGLKTESAAKKVEKSYEAWEKVSTAGRDAEQAANELAKTNAEIDAILQSGILEPSPKPKSKPTGGGVPPSATDPKAEAQKRIEEKRAEVDQMVALAKAAGQAEAEIYAMAAQAWRDYIAARKAEGPALLKEEIEAIDKEIKSFEDARAVAEVEATRRAAEEAEAIRRDFESRYAHLSDDATERRIQAIRDEFEERKQILLDGGATEAQIEAAINQEIARVHEDRADQIIGQARKCSDEEIAETIRVLQAYAAKYAAMGEAGAAAYEKILSEIEALEERRVQLVIGSEEEMTETTRQEAMARLQVELDALDRIRAANGKLTAEEQRLYNVRHQNWLRLKRDSDDYWRSVQSGIQRTLTGIAEGSITVDDLLMDAGAQVVDYFANIVAAEIVKSMQAAAAGSAASFTTLFAGLQAGIAQLEAQVVALGAMLGLSPGMSKFLGGAGLGAGLGMLIGGDAISSTLGSLAGAAVGMWLIPGLGPIVGGLLGGLLGGLFGKKKQQTDQYKDPLQELNEAINEYHKLLALAKESEGLDPFASILASAIIADKKLEEQFKKLKSLLGVQAGDLANAISGAFDEVDFASFNTNWRQALYKTTLDALTKAFMASNVMKPYLDALSNLVGAAVADGVLSPEELAAIQAQMDAMAPTLEAFYGTLADLMKELGLGAEGAGGAGAGGGIEGYQITEFTGPAANKLTELLTPLDQMYNLVGLVADIRRYLIEDLPANRSGIVVTGDLVVYVNAEDIQTADAAARAIFEAAANEAAARGVA